MHFSLKEFLTLVPLLRLDGVEYRQQSEPITRDYFSSSLLQVVVPTAFVRLLQTVWAEQDIDITGF